MMHRTYLAPAGMIRPGMTIEYMRQLYIVEVRNVSLSPPAGVLVTLTLRPAERGGKGYRAIEGGNEVKAPILDDTLVRVHEEHRDLPFCDLSDDMRAKEFARYARGDFREVAR